MTREETRSGFSATLAAIEAIQDPRAALPLVAAALAEDPPVRREALQFLLERQGIEPAAMVVRAFAALDPPERAEALADRARLVTAAEAVLGDPKREGRMGLAALASALPPAEGLRFILHLVDDPAEAVRGIAREALSRIARSLAGGRWSLPGPADARRFTAACELVLKSTPDEEASALVAALLRASTDFPEARTALRAQATRGVPGVRAIVLGSLLEAPPAAAVPIILDLAAVRPPIESVLGILRRRRDPEFLGELAREASRRMESPAGIPAQAGTALAQVAWEEMPAADLAALPAAAQKRLLAIARTFHGDLPARARRTASFLKSRERRVRELALDALVDYPPATYKEHLPALLEDPAEEIQLRAAELLARAGTADSRRCLAEKARRASDRVRRFILGRLASTRFPEAVGAAAVSRAARGRPFEEYSFPVVSPSIPLSKLGGGR